MIAAQPEVSSGQLAMNEMHMHNETSIEFACSFLAILLLVIEKLLTGDVGSISIIKMRATDIAKVVP